MKVELLTQRIKDALKMLSKIPGDTKINVVGDITTLIKSDSSTVLSVSIEGYSEENGKLVLPEETVELIKKLKDNCFTLTEEYIQAGSKTIRLKNIVEDYNEEILNGEWLFTTAEKELHRLLEVKYAMAQDDVRPILKGVCFNKNETCALDGLRMSVRKGSYDSSAVFVLNKSTVELLNSLLDSKSDEEVSIYGDEKLENIKFEFRGIEVRGKTLSGEFINYKAIIPDEHNYTATVNASSLKEELSFIQGIKTNVLRLNFTEDKLILITNQCKEKYDEEASREKTEELRKQAHEGYKEKYKVWASKKAKAEKANKPFKVKCPEEKIIKSQRVYSLIPISDIKIELDCHTKFDSKDENSFDIAVNPKYLTDGVKTYSDEVELRMTSPVSPIVVTNDGENLELVLPVRFVH